MWILVGVAQVVTTARAAVRLRSFARSSDEQNEDEEKTRIDPMAGTASERVRLTGKTKKGKDRARMRGRVWIVQPNDNNPGALLLKSVDGNDLRWVKIIDDPDFNMENE